MVAFLLVMLMNAYVSTLTQCCFQFLFFAQERWRVNHTQARWRVLWNGFDITPRLACASLPDGCLEEHFFNKIKEKATAAAETCHLIAVLHTSSAIVYLLVFKVFARLNFVCEGFAHQDATVVEHIREAKHMGMY